MRIHKEGFRILLITLILLLGTWVAVWLWGGKNCRLIVFILTTLTYAFMIRFFRKPKRPANIHGSCVISPCDGKVVAIEEVDEPEYLKGRAIQVSIFMSVWNVHINWYPIAGRVAYYKYHPGKFLVAWAPKSSTLNERTSIAVEHQNGSVILFRQVAGILARRIVCYAQADEQVEQGQEVGFIKFGSRVDLFLPLGTDVEVAIGQKVKGRQTSIARLSTPS